MKKRLVPNILLAIFLFSSMFLYVGSGSRGFAENSSPLFYFALEKETPRGADIAVKVMIDSPVPLNAYRIVVTYPQEVLDFVGFNDSRSIIEVWQTKPSDEKEGEFEIVGGNFTPFSGTHGEIGTAAFNVRQEDRARIAFAVFEAYRADGKGTKADASFANLTLDVKQGGETMPQIKIDDTTPPKVEFISLIEDPFNENQNLLGFAVRDRETGVREVLVRARRWWRWSEWRSAENPLAVAKNVWAVNIRTVDNAGNFTAQIIYYWPTFFKTVFPVSAVLALFLLFAFLRTRKKKT